MLSKKNSAYSLIAFIFLCLSLGFIGSFWTMETVATWYPALSKPSWTPPNWLFGPVWTLLYVMIAFSGWLIFKEEKSPERSEALIFYAIQLSLNFIWPYLFFSLKSPLLGLIDIVLLLIFIILTLFKSWTVRPLAALLLAPYLLWVSYAFLLNLAIWGLNR